MDLKKIVAANIRKYRTYLKLSQYELSAAADLSLTYINDLEHGKKFPSEKTFNKLSNALQIEPYQLMYQERDNQPVDPTILENIKYDLEKSFAIFLNDKLNSYKAEK